MNKVILAGRLSADPELRYTADGTPVVNFSIAENRRIRKKDGSFEDSVQFIRVSVFGPAADNFAKYKKKGDWVEVDGRIEVREGKPNEEGKKTFYQNIVARSIFYGPNAQRKEGEAPSQADEMLPGEEVPYFNTDDLPF